MDRHVKWLRRRIIASVATQTAEVFAVVAVVAFALMYWRTSEGPLTSLFGAVVIAQLVAGARIGHAMRNNPLNYVFMRKYVDRPFTYRVSRFQGEEQAHPVAERLPGFAPVATIRDAEAEPEPVFDVYHDPSRLVAASVSRASGSVALISSLADGRIMVTDARAIPPHERLVMNLTPEDTLESVIATHRRGISARSDVVELASSAHQVVLDSLAIEYDSYLALGPTLSPFLDLESNRRSWLRLSARIKPEELAMLPVRLGPDSPLPPARLIAPDSSAPVAAAAPAVAVPVPQGVAPQIDVPVPQVVLPEIAAAAVVVPDVAAPAGVVVAPDIPAPTTVQPAMAAPQMVALDTTEPAVVLPDLPVPYPFTSTPESVPISETVAADVTVSPGPMSTHDANPAPALSAAVASEVVALVIPDPRKTPEIVVSEIVVVPEVSASAEQPRVLNQPDEVVHVAPQSAVVGPTRFVTLEPELVDIANDPAPITAEVPAVVINQAPRPPLPADLLASLPTTPTIDVTPPAGAAPIPAAPLTAAGPSPASLPDYVLVDPTPIHFDAAPVGPPATLAEAVQPAPDTAAALVDNVLQQAPPDGWQPHPGDFVHPVDSAQSIDADVPDLATALGYSGTSSSSRPRLSAVLRANGASGSATPPQKRSRRKSR